MTPTLAQLIAHFVKLSEAQMRANLRRVADGEGAKENVAHHMAHQAACNTAILQILERTQMLAEVSEEMKLPGQNFICGDRIV